MAVYPICQHPDCGGRRRERCNSQSTHKRYTGWVANWQPSRTAKRLQETFDHDLDNPKELAEDRLATWKTDRKRGAMGFFKGTATAFGPLADKYYLEHAAVEGRKPERSTIYLVDQWKEWLGSDRKVSPLTEEEMVAFQNDLRTLQRQWKVAGLAGATINRRFNIGRSICERGREWGLVKANPFEFVTRVQEDEPPVRFLEQSEIDKLFATANQLISEYGNPVTEERKKRLIQFMRVIDHTGARPSSIEECNQDNGDVDLANKILWFTTYKGGRKHKKHRYPVPIDDDLLPLVVARVEETGGRGPIFDCQDMAKMTRQVVEQSGVNKGKPEHMHFTIYGLKHSYASRMLMRGATLFDVATLLGHTDTRMVQKHYGHLTLDHLRGIQAKAHARPELKVVG